MRIVAGKNKGTTLKSPKDLSIRPTSEKVREALFDILGISVEEAYFLENIKDNLEKTKNSQNALVYKIDFLSGLKLLARKNILLDYIFLDPPYNKGLVNISLLEISKLPILRCNGLAIAQHYKKEKVIENLNNLSLYNQRRYGECYLSFYEYVNI